MKTKQLSMILVLAASINFASLASFSQNIPPSPRLVAEGMSATANKQNETLSGQERQIKDAVMNDDTKQLFKLLSDAKPELFRFALQEAIAHQKVNLVKLLIATGLNLKAPFEKIGKTPLVWAQYQVNFLESQQKKISPETINASHEIVQLLSK